MTGVQTCALPISANADQWFAPKPGAEVDVALAMVHTIVTKGLSSPPDARLSEMLAAYGADSASSRTGLPAATIEKLAEEFARAKASVAIAGGASVSGEHATELQMAVQLLNYVTGRIGTTARLEAVIFSARWGSAPIRPTSQILRSAASASSPGFGNGT